MVYFKMIYIPFLNFTVMVLDNFFIMMIMILISTRPISEPKNGKNSNSSYRRNPWRILLKVISLMVASVDDHQCG